jgi:uncharacterized protein
MLIEFRFGNFRSFKDVATLSMVAASKIHADPELDAGNVVNVRDGLDALRVAAIYGANASGKSNIITAFATFLKTVAQSANVGFESNISPFLFDQVMHASPSFFEMLFFMDGVVYRYGFELIHREDTQDIVSEWLYDTATTSIRERSLFKRDSDIISFGTGFSEGKSILNKNKVMRRDALYLSLLSQVGTPISSRIVKYISRYFNCISGLNDFLYRDYTEKCLVDGRYIGEISSLVKEADTGIDEVLIMKDEDLASLVEVKFEEDMPEDERQRLTQRAFRDSRLRARHIVQSERQDSNSYDVPFSTFESQGTKKLLSLAGPVFNTLEHGKTLIVDEIDAKFHPLLTRALISIFQSPKSNPLNAQLIFATHDTNLLHRKQLRRDQIWFVEKDRFGSSHLYSLAEFKGVRKDDDFEENYIKGRYGAIPYLGDLTRLFQADEFADAHSDDVTSPRETADAGS